MRADPKPPNRPLVVLGGWRTPITSAWLVGRRLRHLTGLPRHSLLAVDFLTCGSFEAAIARTLTRVERRWPSDDPHQTVAVDVIGISMGGLVARAAASTPPDGVRRRLRVVRLFTLATPHRGARLARHLAPDAAARDMRPGSVFLARLDSALSTAEYQLICYARLRDRWVGEENTAPAGMWPIWTDPPGLLSHQTITLDRLILTDVARRLRGEPPLGHPSPIPL